MKYIIIKNENAEKIMKIFKEVQGKSRERIIKNFDDILEITESVDRRLEDISKAAKTGTVIEYNFQQPFANAYKYPPMSTHFRMIFDKGNWRLDTESVKRKYCPNTSKREYNLSLSETAQKAILKLYE